MHPEDNEYTILVLKKLDKMDERIDNIDKTLAVQEVHLGEHIRRTEQNEGAIEVLKGELKPVIKTMEIIQLVAKIFISIGGLGIIGKLIESIVFR